MSENASILDAVFSGAGVGLCLVDETDHVVRANEIWILASSVGRCDVVGRDLWELFPETPPDRRRLLAEVRAGKTIDLPPHTWRRRWCRGRLAPIALPDGVGVLFTLEDITEQKRYEDAAPVVRWVTDAEGKNQFVNRGYREFFGVTNEKVAGDDWLPLLHPDDADAYLAAFTTAFRARGRFVAEARVRRADGAWRWIVSHGEPQFGEEHELRGYIGVCFDVTERRQADEALRESEQLFHETLDGMLEGCILLSSDFRYLYLNAAAEIYGRRRSSEMLGRRMTDVYAGLEKSELWATLQRCMAERTPLRTETRFDHPDGTFAWFDLSIQPRGDGLLLISFDITERKRADEALAKVRDELRAIVQASPLPILAVDPDGKVILWSAAAEELFGWKAEEVIGFPPPYVPPERTGEFEEVLRDATHRSTVAAKTTVRCTRDGRHIPVSLTTAPLLGPNGESRGAVALIIDLSERKALRRALVESERRFTVAFDASPLAKVLVRTADRRPVEVNRAFLELFGLERDDVVDSASYVLPIAQTAAAGERFWNRVAEEQRVTETEFEFTRRSGQKGHALAFGERIALGGEDFLLLAVQDVTDRQSAERALRESEERFRQLAETIGEVFWLTDPSKNQIIYISPGYDAIWGRPGERLYTHPQDWLDAIHPDDRARVLEAAMTKQVAGLYDEEYRIVRPDGSMRWIRDRGFPVRDAAGNVIRIAGVAADITERRDLEAQLRQTQKMESIGLLAGGIAHDFNNWLTVISANAELLEPSLPDELEPRALLREIRHAGERAASLTRQLLAFSRREVVEQRVVDLSTIIIDTEKVLARVLGEDVLLKTSLGATASRVKVDPGSWVQVMMNLAVNARDAMPRGGTLTLETRNVTVDGERARSHPGLARGAYVVLAIKDTGAGMSPEVRSRVFEPFFTTKGLGRGTGLGLAVVHGIVIQSGGHVEVSSEIDVGTTFELYLPLVEEESAPSSKVAPRSEAARGHETILVVEDEASIRRIAIRALGAQGYTVLEAGDGKEALELMEKHEGPIDLLLTDVVMPRMDGRELAEALHVRFPTLRVLYTSGYTDDAVMRHGIQHAEVSFIAKPYAVADLRQKVRDVLDRP